ncbi:MAG: glycosyltransferase [Planctomycetes bacterium]|nr:glycosyltransferase [Planctomycetota bacterium]
MNQVRIHGDPFGDDAPATLLRNFLRLALGSGVRCALSLSAVRPRAATSGEHEIALTDGVRDLRVGTRLPPAEVELLLRAAGEAVAATAPLLVFAAASERDDQVQLAGFEWRQACRVLAVREGTTAGELLERVRAELRWSGQEQPPHALDAAELAPWLALPGYGGGGPIVHVGGDDFAAGTDLVIAAWRAHFAAVPLRLVLPDADAEQVAHVLQQLGEHHHHVEILRHGFDPALARDAAAIVLPMRRLDASRTLVLALAAGRPVCVSRFDATAALLDGAGICFPIGGRIVPASAEGTHFAPDAAALVSALRQALADGARAAATGRRARQHVVQQLTRGRPTSPPPALSARAGSRPTVVLEAPFFETSSSAELSIETALALQQRGAVELRLVTNAPLRTDLDWLRRRAPSLLPLLCRDPGLPDLWLSSGWPVRAARPRCRRWAVRVDWEYGELPFELLPHVTQEADLVVVHSEHVRGAVLRAGATPAKVHLVPHGVDACMHEQAPPDPEVLAFKRGRPAVLFCGGLVWRKGFDVYLRAAFAARAAGHDLCLVVKTTGHDQHYGRFHLGELLRRVQRTPGAPPLLATDDDLPRSRLASLYAACDVMLHPYRGEGFCMPVLEARASGLPVLATAGGATTALMHGPGAVEIPSTRREVELPDAHVASPWVLEPDPVAAGRQLAELLADLPAQQAAARGFARSVRAAFRWSEAAATIEALAGAGASTGSPGTEPIVTLPTMAAAQAAAGREPRPQLAPSRRP